ncbi:chromate transporter [Nonomuraea thailandensis]
MTIRTSEDVIPFRQAVRAWFLISLQTFGGPAGQIAVMQRTLVEEKRWIGQGASTTRSTTACCCQDRRPSNLPSTSAGCSTAPGAGWWPGRCSCCPACWRC